MRKLFSILFILTSFITFSATAFMLPSSHATKVTVMCGQNDYYASGSIDGSVIVWKDNAPISRFQGSNKAITNIVMHPSEKLIAYTTQNEAGKTVLIAWNFERNYKKYTKELPSEPLFMNFTSGGTYLIYTLAELDSIQVLSASTGRKLNMLKDVSGIISSFHSPANEDLIILYQAITGKIEIRNMKTKDIIVSTSTYPGLKLISPNLIAKGFMAAEYRGDLVFINLSNGKQAAIVNLNGVTAISNLKDSDRIAVVAKSTAGYMLRDYTVSINENRELIVKEGESNRSIVKDTAIQLTPNGIITGSEDGELYAVTANSETVYGENILTAISSVTFDDESIYIASNKNLIKISSNEKMSKTFRFSSFKKPETKIINSSIPENAQLISVDEGIIAWSASSREIKLFNREDGSLIRDFGRLRNEIIDLSVNYGWILCLENNGQITEFKLEDGTKKIGLSIQGLQQVDYLNESTILCAGSSSSGFNTSLLTISRETGETAPKQDDALYYYEMKSTRSGLALIGIKESNDRLITIVKTMSENGSSRVIYTAPREDVFADLEVDPVTSAIYTNAGSNLIRKVSGQKRSYTLDRTYPRRIDIGGQFLSSINADGSISLWHTKRAYFIGDLYLLKDGSWIAVDSSGKRYFSQWRTMAALIALSGDYK